MGYLTRNLRQKMVYWGNPQPDGYGGYTYDDPVEIKGRWEEREELFIDSAGVQQVSRARVFIDQDVVVDGYLLLAELSTVSSGEEGSPGTVDGAFRIRGYRKTPNLRATDYERKAWLLCK